MSDSEEKIIIPYVVYIDTDITPAAYKVGPALRKVPAWVAWGVVLAASVLVMLMFTAVLIMVSLFTGWCFAVAALIGAIHLTLRLRGRQGFYDTTDFVEYENGQPIRCRYTDIHGPREAFARR